jgi:hypothetical protein
MHDLDLALRELEPEYEGSNALEWQLDGTEPDSEYESEGIEPNEEYELASELLEATSDEELEHFLGKLFKKVSAAARGPLSSVMRRVAKKALPMLGTAAGTFFGGPAGSALGAKLGGAAGQMFGLELEGLSPEDQELEVARRVVRLASDAARQLAIAGPSGNLTEAAKNAVMSAAATHAPGLLSAAGPAVAASALGGAGESGRWIRRGRRIVLLDV